ncbi:MAG TPA: DNA polymerase III subunit gamma/tau [Candidatus Goldiibacteriota bacterium]|nr:DNA polymerase III subunit gamma/tau [Candidatus Goldiibacteriota bacterium]
MKMTDKYLVYTRKWRPQDFNSIIGQDQVIKPIMRAIETGRIMHSYLFSGPRGVGKTTTARVFAKALNCKEGPTVNPCGVCPSCTEIKDGSSLDVIEIDGASNRGIDKIRELREQVGFSAARSRYKVYIIDEVHMLTTEAFNALLKTLEEPPRHVIFIFATTDPQNIPQTILSRCQHFRFKRAAISTIIENIKMIAAREKIDAEPEAIKMIAKAGDGALRDGQRIFDQAVTFAKGGKLTASAVAEMLGEIESDKLFGLIKNVFNRDLKAALASVENVITDGYDLKHFTRGIVETLRNLLVMKSSGDTAGIDSTEDEIREMAALSALADKKTVLLMLQKAIDTESRLSRSNVPGIIVETFVADMILSSGAQIPDVPVAITEKKEIKAPVKAAQEAEPEKEDPEETPARPGLLIEEIEEEEEIKNLTADIIEKKWPNVIERAGRLEYGEEVIPSIENAKVALYENETLTIIGENPFMAELIKKHAERIKEVLKEEFKRDMKLVVYAKDEYRKKVNIQKEVTQEEAMNLQPIKDLSKVFKIQSVEIKKHGKHGG